MNAKLDVMGICAALKFYYQECGAWPAGDEAEKMATLRGKNSKGAHYYEAWKVTFNARGEVMDPWNTPYRFGATEAGLAWAYSWGANKRDEGGAAASDDVVSWSQ